MCFIIRTFPQRCNGQIKLSVVRTSAYSLTLVPLDFHVKMNVTGRHSKKTKEVLAAVNINFEELLNDLCKNSIKLLKLKNVNSYVQI